MYIYIYIIILLLFTLAFFYLSLCWFCRALHGSDACDTYSHVVYKGKWIVCQADIQMQILYNYNAFRFKIAKLFNYFNVKLCIWTGTRPVVYENINAWKKSRPQLFALIAQSSRWSSWPGRRVGTCLKRWAHETKEIHIDIENWLQKKCYIYTYIYVFIYIYISLQILQHNFPVQIS